MAAPASSSLTRKYPAKLIRWMSILGLLIPIVMSLGELPMLKPDDKTGYLFGRAFMAVLCLLVYAGSYGRERAWVIPTIFFAVVFYAVHGQQYLPGYYMAYMEIIVPMGLFFPIPNKQFRIMVAIAVIAMVTSLIVTDTTYATDPIMITKLKADATMGVIVTTVLSLLGHHFITRARYERDLLAEKFLDIGRHASSLIHDFKGLLSTPLTYVEVLKNELPETGIDKRHEEIINYLHEDLAYLTKYVHEMNALGNVREENRHFDLVEVLDVINIVLRNQLRQAKLQLKNNVKLKFNSHVLVKVFYNLILNSIESHSDRRETSKILIDIEWNQANRSIFIRDNGPGFPANTMTNLNAGRISESGKRSGSGIGIYLVFDLATSHGCRMYFRNRPEGGAEIQIMLPAAAVVTADS